MRATIALLAPLLAFAGCVRANWYRINVDGPLAQSAVHRLEPGADLDRCLRELGAPSMVWENDGGVVLAYAWLDQADWSVSASFAVQRFVSASFNYADSDLDLNGVVLLLDENLRLQSIRRGQLREITTDLRRRPSAVVD
jgi:hypothetical protein